MSKPQCQRKGPNRNRHCGFRIEECGLEKGRGKAEKQGTHFFSRRFDWRSPEELDGLLSVGKPTHQVKHFCFCASWEKFKKWWRERRIFYFGKVALEKVDWHGMCESKHFEL